MKILIYGGGAVGLGIGSCLIKSGVSLDIIARPNTVKCLLQEGLRRTGIFGDYVASPTQFNSYTNIDSLPKTDYDYILIMSKAYDVEPLCKALFFSKSLNPINTKIIIFNNGWGTHEIVSQFTNKTNIYNARVITGFIRNKPNKVDITVHADAIHIGSLYNTDNLFETSTLSKLINDGGIPCESVSDIMADLWAKMLYNCALNPLGAILEVNYGELGEHSGTRSIMENVIQETFDVMIALGYHTHWTSVENYISSFYSTFLPSTYAHNSSMLQDICAGKKTEIDFLNGVIVEGAKKTHQIECTNSLLRELIKFKEVTGACSKTRL